MPDILTPEQRHECMSHIRSKNTKPEVRLRKRLFCLGYRYRLNVKKLPGTPDMVLAKYRTCIFVNGCFWHGHKGCSKFVRPRTNAEFWQTKIENNRERDLRDYTLLESLGWRVIVVWECELTVAKMDDTLSRVVAELNTNKKSWEDDVSDRRKRSEEWREEIKENKEILRLTTIVHVCPLKVVDGLYKFNN